MSKNICRRDFIKQSSHVLGLGALGTAGLNPEPVRGSKTSGLNDTGLTGEVWAAGMTLISLQHNITREDRIKRIIERMEEVVPLQPDIICLPETLPEAWISKRPPISERAEEVPGPIVNRFAEFAKKHGCYIICPLLTKKDGRIYNAAVLIDRGGSVVGEYRKMYPVSSEIKAGITPGPAEPPVFDTDFGRIGIQICFDANWQEGWRSLSKSGAEIVFFTSMFDGGRILNSLARDYEFYIVSSTWATAARIIDITGDELYRSGRYPIKWVCGPVNLDKKVFHWNHFRKIREIREKYGRKLIVKSYEDEGCLTIESNSPDITVSEVMEEFDLITYRQYLKNEGDFSDKYRI